MSSGSILVRGAVLSLAVISLVAAGCGSAESSRASPTSEPFGDPTETVDTTSYGSTVASATDVWRAWITKNIKWKIVRAECLNAVGADFMTTDPNYYECG